jgi:methionine-rich copper-binding protein CopC
MLFTLVISATAFAHTALTEATPGDGAMMKQGPAHINLTFNGPVKLVKLELMGVGHEMPTNFESNSEAKNAFMIETPGMHPGAFTVNWAVIGEDGHTVADSYSFTVDPSITEEHTGESAGNSH